MILVEDIARNATTYCTAIILSVLIGLGIFFGIFAGLMFYNIHCNMANPEYYVPINNSPKVNSS